MSAWKTVAVRLAIDYLVALVPVSDSEYRVLDPLAVIAEVAAGLEGTLRLSTPATPAVHGRSQATCQSAVVFPLRVGTAPPG